MSTSAFWFRRDLRLTDNTGLSEAILSNNKILAVFIFDTNIINELEPDDLRVNFIYDSLFDLNNHLSKFNAGILILKGNPVEIWKSLIDEYKLNAIYTNHDYEPYAIQRDNDVSRLCADLNVAFKSFKDQVIFERNEIVKDDGNPYTVFTPYKNKWITTLNENIGLLSQKSVDLNSLISPPSIFPDKQQIGLSPSKLNIQRLRLDKIDNYEEFRNIPSKNSGSYLGLQLRFGTVSIREIVGFVRIKNNTFLNQLIWREFFMQILYHFPSVINNSFKSKYDQIKWVNDLEQFEKWCKGETGYPMVDAGMRQLNQTGYMHNRVRMVTASFLVKHLLIDWRWGESYFAKKLLDFELSSNNGNWQWAAGTGCDAVPYFRIFNPIEQQKKFDPNFTYIKTWVKEFGTNRYPKPMIEHRFARKRALNIYKETVSQS